VSASTNRIKVASREAKAATKVGSRIRRTNPVRVASKGARVANAKVARTNKLG
jgi:hypothetical protein